MSETTTESTDTSAQGQDTGDETSTTTTEDTTDWKAEARKWEARAKENTAAAKQAEKARMAAMSDSERAIEEARQAARSEATKSFGMRLARTEFDAAAGRRNPGFDVAPVLEVIDLGKFVGDDGEPDIKAIKATVERLVPEGAGAPSFDGGTRKSTAKTGDMDALIRKAAGRA